MPGMGGVELTKAIKRESPQTPVILLTADEFDEKLQARFEGKEPDFVFRKPFESVEVAAKLTELI